MYVDTSTKWVFSPCFCDSRLKIENKMTPKGLKQKINLTEFTFPTRSFFLSQFKTEQEDQRNEDVDQMSIYGYWNLIPEGK